jgi:hypothetical protein
LEDNYREKLKENYSIVEKGYNSFPTRIPGTAYSKALLVSCNAMFWFISYENIICTFKIGSWV